MFLLFHMKINSLFTTSAARLRIQTTETSAPPADPLLPDARSVFLRSASYNTEFYDTASNIADTVAPKHRFRLLFRSVLSEGRKCSFLFIQACAVPSIKREPGLANPSGQELFMLYQHVAYTAVIRRNKHSFFFCYIADMSSIKC